LKIPNYKPVVVLILKLSLVSLSVVVLVVEPSLSQLSPSSAGQQLADDYDQIWGDPDAWVTQFEDDLKPMLNQYMGLGISAAGFGIVARSLLK
jgi:hypothetical protein